MGVYRPDVSDVSSIQIMTTQTTTANRSAVTPLFPLENIADVITFEYTSDSKKSARLQLMQNPPWNMMNDLSLGSGKRYDGGGIREAYTGINALLKVAEGMLWGNENLIITAPPEKLLAKYGSGTYGYVNSKYNTQTDAFSFEFDGAEHVVPVTQDMVPTEDGWVRLTVDCGKLIVLDDEPLRDRNFEEGGPYAYCQALSAIVGGSNVSVSIGPKTMEAALNVMDMVIASGDPVAGVGTYRFAKRERGRAYDTRNENAEEIDTAVENGEKFSNTTPELLVPLMEGGELSLADWPVSKKVPIFTAGTFIPVGGLKIAEDTIPARLAVARTIHQSDYVVKIS